MELLPLSLLAGVLTVLSPCVLPLLPVVLAGSAAGNRRAPYLVIGSLAVSVVIFTLLIKATTALLGVPSNVWLIVSGSLVAFIGASLAFPRIWDTISSRVGLSSAAGTLADRSAQKTGTARSLLLGLSLGPVFTSCSPTYGLILAVVLPANTADGIANILAYTIGLSAVMLAVAVGGRSVTKRLGWATDPEGTFRRGLGLFLVIVGLLIATGTIRTIESWLIDRGLLGAVVLEQGILDSVGESDTSDAHGSRDTALSPPVLPRDGLVEGRPGHRRRAERRPTCGRNPRHRRPELRADRGVRQSRRRPCAGGRGRHRGEGVPVQHPGVARDRQRHDRRHAHRRHVLPAVRQRRGVRADAARRRGEHVRCERRACSRAT